MSFFIIYLRLGNEFTEEKVSLLYDAALSAGGLACFGLSLALIPLNWGIEAYKWKLITAPIQWVSYKTATKSVYSGVCLGNLAPGRATEFVAKIIFFKIENRPKITVLHFVGGMFQLSITIIVGFFAILFRINQFQDTNAWITYVVFTGGILMVLLLALSIYYINPLLNFISKKIRKGAPVEDFHYTFTPLVLVKLFGFSLLRYSVFCLQFCLLLAMFNVTIDISILTGVTLYFLITTLIPMISLLEAAIRAAIALIVFKDAGISNTVLALSSVLIWLVNIIIPSIAGYIILLRQNFNFKLFKTQK
ncbi:MAG: flippase-like domain-containing protein [Bacteroidia bacterium]|nr:flippase-like domain-containing protein [Bacteroidia bacterium]